MAKKKLNLKPLLLEKGERYGLVAAAVLSGLLVAFGVMKGFTSGSAQANAEALEKQTAALDQKFKNSTPTSADLPGPPTGTDAFLLASVDPSQLSSRSLFWPSKIKDMMRQVPGIFAPEDFQVAVIRTPLPSLDFLMGFQGEREVPKSVAIFKKSEGGAAGDKTPPNPFGNSKQAQALAAMIAAQSGAKPPPTKTPKNTLGYTSGPRSVQGAEVKHIPISEADGLKDGWILADKVLPVRMAVIAGVFPYKKQVEEFRQKLRLDTHGAVLTERVRGEKGESWNSFQFRGILVQRAVVELGQPLQWEDINIEEPYKKLLIMTGRHLEEDPKKYKPVKDVSLGLVLDLPKPYRENQYPDLLGKLNKLDKVLTDLADAGKSKEIITPKLANDNFNPFDPLGQGTKFEPDPDAPVNPELKTNPFVIAGTGAQREIKETPIEYCMFRFLDVELEQGKVYRYRIKVKMANPNYSPKPAERKDTYPQFAKDKELISPEWVEIPQSVVVPPDSAIFVDKPKSTYEANLHMQRWVGEYRPDPKKPETRPVGEWITASNISVRRGEYLRDRNVKAPIPIKNLDKTHFEVDDKSVMEFGDESVLVNFEGGKVRHERVFGDESAYEILVMTPDGRVYARNTTSDEANPERTVHEQEYKARIKEIKDAKSGGDFNFNK